MDNWITPKEASDLTGYDENYCRFLARNYPTEIVSRKFGHALMIDRESILAYRERRDAEKEQARLERESVKA